MALPIGRSDYFTLNFPLSWEASVPHIVKADDTLGFPRAPYPMYGGDRELFWGLREGMTAYLWGVYDEVNRTFRNLGELELATLSGTSRSVEATGLSLRRLVENYNLFFGASLDWQKDILFKGVWSLNPHVSQGLQSFYGEDEDDLIRGRQETGWITYEELRRAVIDSALERSDAGPSPGLQRNVLLTLMEEPHKLDELFLTYICSQVGLLGMLLHLNLKRCKIFNYLSLYVQIIFIKG